MNDLFDKILDKIADFCNSDNLYFVLGMLCPALLFFMWKIFFGF